MINQTKTKSYSVQCRLFLLFWVFLWQNTTAKIKKPKILEKPSEIPDPDVPIFCEPTSTFFSLVEDLYHSEYVIETEDGYLLTLFRVFKNSNNIESNPNFEPTLLIHGIVDSADDWALGPTSVVQNFAAKGLDVWLMNTRGNKYSCKHSKMSASLPKFWNFSFQEFAKYDFPAVVKFIFSKTNKKIIVVGHSQGTTQVFAGFSEDETLVQYIKKFHAVAPIAYLNGFDPSNVWNFLAMHDFLNLIENMGIHRILEKKLNDGWASDAVLKLFCGAKWSVCAYIMSKLTDRDPSQLDKSQMYFFLKHNPSRAGTKSFKHFAQQIVNFDGHMRKYDYGESKNVDIYGTSKPPIYDISKIKVPVYIYFGDNDLLCTIYNVERIKKEVGVVKSRFYAGWGHLSYFWGLHRIHFVNELLEDVLE